MPELWMNYWREDILGQINVPDILVSDEYDEEDDNIGKCKDGKKLWIDLILK